MPDSNSNKLNPKQRLFVAEYLVDHNATAAAIRAHYAPKWAYKNAHRLTAHEGIAREIERRTVKLLSQRELSAERVLEEVRRVAFSDITAYYDVSGRPKALDQLSADERAALMSISLGQGRKRPLVRLWDKIRALELLAEYYQLLERQVDTNVEIVVRWASDETGPLSLPARTNAAEDDE